MPQRIPGIKKETKSTASVASNDITSSDIKSLISAMEDWVSEFKSASKLKSTSKSDAEALNKAVKELSGVIKDSKELEEQREDLLKKSANLSEDQRKRVMEAFDSKVVSQYKKLAKVTDIVDPLALSLTSDKFGKKRADIYTKSLQETVSILKRIDERAEERSKKEEIVAQNKKAKDSVSKFGSDAIDTVLNPLFHSLLGPLQLFTQPLEQLFKVDLYQIPKSLAVLRKKTPASRERVLAEGGVFGAGMVLIHDAITGKKEDREDTGGIIESAISGAGEGLAESFATKLFNHNVGGNVGTFSKALGFMVSPTGLILGAVAAGVGLSIWNDMKGEWKDSQQQVEVDLNVRYPEPINLDPSSVMRGGAGIAYRHYGRADALGFDFNQVKNSEGMGDFLLNSANWAIDMLSFGTQGQRAFVEATMDEAYAQGVDMKMQEYIAQLSYLYNFYKQQGEVDKANAVKNLFNDPEMQKKIFGTSLDTSLIQLTDNGAIGDPNSGVFGSFPEWLSALETRGMRPYTEEELMEKFPKPEDGGIDWNAGARAFQGKFGRTSDREYYALAREFEGIWSSLLDSDKSNDELWLSENSIPTLQEQADLLTQINDVLHSIEGNTAGITGTGGTYSLSLGLAPALDFSGLRL